MAKTFDPQISSLAKIIVRSYLTATDEAFKEKLKAEIAAAKEAQSKAA